jgi:NAD(P)-dependent dehydrogenase (short-subunit alcohol dehydrogenase family)
LIDLTGKVSIVTGAGHGLGRAHALALARRGACVMVNDIAHDAAEKVCRAIAEEGGQAVPFAASVTDRDAVEAMVAAVVERWGRIDILVNNAGILRDRTFAKLDIADFLLVCDVHLMGSVHCTKAVWPHMQRQGGGRIVLTTSSSGLFGNFGQSNYGAAKMALVGLMQTLALEGDRYGIAVNCLAPSAATAMTDGLYPAEALKDIGPDLVSPAVVALACDEAPTRTIMLAGAGSFEVAHVTMTRGVCYPADEVSAERILSDLARISDRQGEMVPESGAFQYRYEVGQRAGLNKAANVV